MDLSKEEIVRILKNNFFYTMGCTDPVSVIFATSSAKSAIGGKVKKIVLSLDKNLFKNAYSTMIPGTEEKGFYLAAVLGLTLENPDKGLLISEDIGPDNVKKAHLLLETLDVEISPYYETDEIYIRAEVYTDKGKGTCVIEKKHDNITLLKNDKETYIDKSLESDEKPFLEEIDQDVNLSQLVDAIKGLSEEDLLFFEENILYNMEAAKLGLAKKTGLALGVRYEELIKKGLLEDSLINRAKMLTAAAADARMGGLKAKIAGCFGSGNHGITLLIPLAVVAEELKVERLKLYQSIALGGILTALVKRITGVITPHCGDIIATGIGLAGGASFLLNKGPKEIENAALLVLAGLYGVICDGAKPTCALKIATAVQSGLESAYLSSEKTENLFPQGILGDGLAETLKNIDFLVKKEGRATDLHILSLLESKSS